jgi:hypothetical protein
MDSTVCTAKLIVIGVLPPYSLSHYFPPSFPTALHGVPDAVSLSQGSNMQDENNSQFKRLAASVHTLQSINLFKVGFKDPG